MTPYIIFVLGAMLILAIVAGVSQVTETMKIKAQAELERAKKWNGEPRTCCCKGHDCDGD